VTDIAEIGYRVDTGGLVKGEKALDRMGSAGDKVEKKSVALTAAFRVAQVGALALAGVVTTGIFKFKDYGAALGEVNTLLDSSWPTDSMEVMNQGIKDLTKEMGGDVVSKTKALYQVISAGASSSAEALDTLTVANKLAIGGVTDITTAITSIAGPLNVYADSNLTATSAADPS